MEIKSLGDLLRDSCRRHASNIAMLAPGKKEFETISYSQLYEKVHAYAGVVKSLGVVRGDKLVILSENCVEWALTDWACQTLGVIVVPIYPTLPADQAAYIVKDCEAKIVVAGDESQKKKIDGIEGVEVAMLRGAGSISELAASKANEIPKAEWEAGIDECWPTVGSSCSLARFARTFRLMRMIGSFASCRCLTSLSERTGNICQFRSADRLFTPRV